MASYLLWFFCLEVDSIVQLDVAVSFKIKTDLSWYSDDEWSSKLAIFIPRFWGFFKTRSTRQCQRQITCLRQVPRLDFS
jgi:hypothetical protein